MGNIAGDSPLASTPLNSFSSPAYRHMAGTEHEHKTAVTPEYVPPNSTGQPTTASKKRKSAQGRQLIRWDFEKDQHLLLCLEYECNRKGLQLPWDEAVQHIKQGATGQAAVQHLAKVRKYRQQKGQPVPPEPTKRRFSKKDGSSKKRKADEDGDDDDDEQAFKGSVNRMVYQPISTNKTPKKSNVGRSRNTAGPTKAPNAKQPAPRRTTTKIKTEDSSETATGNELDAMADSEDEFKPHLESPTPKKKRGGQNRSRAKAGSKASAAQADLKEEATVHELSEPRSRRKATEEVNYKEPEIDEEHEEDGHDDLSYEVHGPYGDQGLDHANEEYGEDEPMPAPTFNLDVVQKKPIEHSDRAQDPFTDRKLPSLDFYDNSGAAFERTNHGNSANDHFTYGNVPGFNNRGSAMHTFSSPFNVDGSGTGGSSFSDAFNNTETLARSSSNPDIGMSRLSFSPPIQYPVHGHGHGNRPEHNYTYHHGNYGMSEDPFGGQGSFQPYDTQPSQQHHQAEIQELPDATPQNHESPPSTQTSGLPASVGSQSDMFNDSLHNSGRTGMASFGFDGSPDVNAAPGTLSFSEYGDADEDKSALFFGDHELPMPPLRK